MLAKIASVSFRSIKKPSPFRVILTVSPAVNGITQWDLYNNGPLILDGGTSTSYTITTSEVNPGNILIKAWGQGTCQATGGYSTGNLSLSSTINLAIRLNAGAGSGGSASGTGISPNGGGYAGIFNSSVSQANALLIASGAGGSGSSTGGCDTSGGNGGGVGNSGSNSPDSQISSTGGGGGTQSSGGAGGTASSSYTKTTTQTVSNSSTEAGAYHERFGGVTTVLNSTGQATVSHTNTFDYNWSFNTPYNNSSYSVSASNVSADQNITANGTVVPAGFSYAIDNKTSNGFRILWFRNDDNSVVNVRYHTITCSGERNVTSSQTIPVSANGSSGSALQGGSGGSRSTGFGSSNASGGGGGGGGYYGGGGGAGGNDYGDTTRNSSGGGGGSGYVSGSLTSASTSGFANGSDPNRGNAGSVSGSNNSYHNSRIVIQYSP